MALSITIDRDEPTAADLALYLRHIADLIDEGYTNGIDWDVSGEADEEESAGDAIEEEEEVMIAGADDGA